MSDTTSVSPLSPQERVTASLQNLLLQTIDPTSQQDSQIATVYQNTPKATTSTDTTPTRTKAVSTTPAGPPGYCKNQTHFHASCTAFTWQSKRRRAERKANTTECFDSSAPFGVGFTPDSIESEP